VCVIMSSVTAQSIQRVLETYQQDRSRYDAYLERLGHAKSMTNINLEEGSGDESISKILNLHWEQMSVAARLEESSNAAEGVTQRFAEEYLSRSMAQKSVVESVMQCVCPKDPNSLIEKCQFLVVAFLISRVLESAQEAALEDDSIWDDEDEENIVMEGIDVGLKRKSLRCVEEEEDSWRIKSMPSGLVSSTVAQDKQDEAIMRTRFMDPGIAIPSEVDASGPLGQGLRSMSFADVRMSGIASSVSKPKEDAEDVDPVWSAFDVAANKSNSTFNSARSITKLGDGYLSSRTLSLACARKKLQNPAVPGSTIKPLTEQEREKCLESFEVKGYRKRGGMPIRDAIDMYHRIKGTNFVHFSKVWGLVDPETVCSIDERGYCALMALIQNIVDQGESVVLPKELREEDISRLVLDPSCQDGQQERTLKLDGLSALLSKPESEADDIDDVETPRTFIGSESDDDWDDASSIGGASVVSRIPSLIGSVKSMSFSLRNLVKNSIKNPRLGSTAKIPGLTANMRASSFQIDTAAWKAQVGNGHQFLKVSMIAAALGTRKDLCNPHVCISFRDPIGRLIELPYEDLHPGIHHRFKGAVMFGNQSKILKTAINRMPPGSSLFFEIKHWKASKKRMSTVAWSFVDADMIIDFGVISRVRQGKLALPLFKKPVDISRQRAKALNSRHPCLYIQVEGLSSETESDEVK